MVPNKLDNSIITCNRHAIRSKTFVKIWERVNFKPRWGFTNSLFLWNLLKLKDEFRYLIFSGSDKRMKVSILQYQCEQRRLSLFFHRVWVICLHSSFAFFETEFLARGLTTLRDFFCRSGPLSLRPQSVEEFGTSSLIKRLFANCHSFITLSY